MTLRNIYYIQWVKHHKKVSFSIFRIYGNIKALHLSAAAHESQENLSKNLETYQ